MSAINFYFQVHQPYRLRRYTVFDLGQNSFYEDDDRNCDMLLYTARNCYLPMNDVLLRCIAKHGKDFRVSFCISGIALEQFEQYAPEVIDSFKALADTGCVEFMGETYANSLACIYAPAEFKRQVKLHSAKIKELFGKKPRVFRNTQLIYDNALAATAAELGFRGVVAEGADHILGWRSPNYVYTPQGTDTIKLLLNNYQLADNITLRFSDRQWNQWPLTADTFASWCHDAGNDADTLNLFMHYETFGLTHKAESGIFAFMEHLPAAILSKKGLYFRTVSEVIDENTSVGVVDVPMHVSWRDAERDLNMWLGNDMQKDAIHALYDLEPRAGQWKSGDVHQTWLRLQSAEHFAYMCTKWFSTDSSILPYTPYNSPYDAYINYMNVLADFSITVHDQKPPRTPAAAAKPTAKKKTANTADEAKAGTAKKAPSAAAKSTARKKSSTVKSADAPVPAKKTPASKTSRTAPAKDDSGTARKRNASKTSKNSEPRVRRGASKA